MSTHLFPTTIIGSLPRPEWVREIVLDRNAGKISDSEANSYLDRAIESAIALLERTGLDELGDGEWRRESYVKVFAERVRGFEHNINPSGGLSYPAVVAPVEYYRSIAVDEVSFVRARTKRRVKATLPAPYIIGRRMWHPEHSKAAYPKPELLMKDTVPILRQEIEAIREAGADVVQLDEPWLSTLVDPEFRKREGGADIQYEMDLCVDLLNETLDGIDGIDTSMHLCHAHFAHKHGTEGPYDLIMPALSKIRVGTISMEYATPVSGGVGSLAQFPESVRLGLGCVDHCDANVETPEKIIERVEAAMEYVDKSRISMHPDCGFAPSVQNPIDLDESYQKLRSMCSAAATLRERYG